MHKLGISIYPDKTTFEEDKAYLLLASSLGYQRVFTSFLQINPTNPQKAIARIKESIIFANSLGLKVSVDIHPLIFKYLKLPENDLSYFHELGVETIRLDMGYTGREEAALTYNSYGINIEINMSNDTHYLQQILDYRPSKDKLCGCFNFYPQAFSGLSEAYYCSCSDRFKDADIKGAVFINSQTAKISPWPIDDGMCTLECHRNLSIETQVKHIKMLGYQHDIIIANAYASKEELMAVVSESQRTVPCFRIKTLELSDIEARLLFQHQHYYRCDSSEYMVRSTKLRFIYKDEALPSHNNDIIKKGDILILNEQYGQYKAEVQIALKDRNSDKRINVVASIVDEELFLLDKLPRLQTFVFKKEDK